MAHSTIDEYLATLDEPKRATLQRLREDIRELVPEAEECISYSLPAFRVRGKLVAGFGAFNTHLSYLPHSGSVLPALAGELTAYPGGTKSALHFPIDRPLPKALVKMLVAKRLEQITLFRSSPGK